MPRPDDPNELLAIIDAIENPVFMKDRAGRFVFVNQALANLLGFPSPDQLLGKVSEDVLPPDTARRIDEDDAQVMRTAQQRTYEECLLLSSGETRWFHTSKTPRKGPDGKVTGLIGISRDITERKQAEERLRLSEERFRGMFEQAPFSIQRLSPDGRTIGVNDAWRQLWNAPPELLEYVLKDYVITEDRELERKGVMPFIRSALAGEAVKVPAIYYDPRELRRGGEGRWVEGYFYPIKDSRGEIREVVLLHNDITLRREAEAALEESERRYRTLVEGSPEVVFLTDLSSRMLFANKALEEQTGYTVADFQIPQEQNTFIHPDDAERVGRFIEEFVNSGARHSGQIENRFLARDGQVKWFSSVISRTTYRGEPALQYVTYDITARKRAEEERERLIVRERQARERAEAALQSREDFLSIAAHELKTPLTPLRMQIFALRRHLGAVLDAHPGSETLTKLLLGADLQLDRLTRLADDLLEVSRITKGRLTLRLEFCDLGEIVSEAVKDHAARAAQASCEVRVEAESISGWWDPNRLRRVASILLSNATKFGERRPIDVRVTAEDGRAVLSVRDYGSGISPEDQVRIFERFERAVSIRHFGGLGLGLFIARRYVEAHGGRIRVESEPGKGATFVVELPARGMEG